MSLSVPCPDHITEVEISSQEVIDAPSDIQDQQLKEGIEDCLMLVNTEEEVAQTSHDVVSEPNTTVTFIISDAEVETSHNGEVKQNQTTPESADSISSTTLSNETRKDQELDLVEQQCEVNDSTVIENLNLIAQAMETRMLESSQVEAGNQAESSPSGDVIGDGVAMEIERTSETTNGNSDCDKKETALLGIQCRTLLDQVKHLTERVQETSVLGTVQGKLQDIVAYMESHISDT